MHGTFRRCHLKPMSMFFFFLRACDGSSGRKLDDCQNADSVACFTDSRVCDLPNLCSYTPFRADSSALVSIRSSLAALSGGLLAKVSYQTTFANSRSTRRLRTIHYHSLACVGRSVIHLKLCHGVSHELLFSLHHAWPQNCTRQSVARCTHKFRFRRYAGMASSDCPLLLGLKDAWISGATDLNQCGWLKEVCLSMQSYSPTRFQ